MILCAGEALIDMIPQRTVGGGAGFAPQTGGAVFNTAVALGRLGARAGLLTGLSRDRFGTLLEKELARSRVRTDLAIRSDRLTTLAVVHLTDGNATYTFYDENSAGRGITPDDLPALPTELDALFCGGISLCNPPAADAYVALAERAADRAVLMVDPNVRPGFAEDVPAYRARLMHLLSFAHIVKVSEEDLGWLYPEGDGVAALMQGPVRLVLLTRGGDGVTAYLADGREVSLPAERAEVVDTVGAGDTFNAGFLAEAQALGLLAGGGFGPDTDLGALRRCLSLGARAAAVTVSRAGADPPWRAELPE